MAYRGQVQKWNLNSEKVSNFVKYVRKKCYSLWNILGKSVNVLIFHSEKVYFFCKPRKRYLAFARLRSGDTQD